MNQSIEDQTLEDISNSQEEEESQNEQSPAVRAGHKSGKELYKNAEINRRKIDAFNKALESEDLSDKVLELTSESEPDQPVQPVQPEPIPAPEAPQTELSINL